ncbi:MAG: hypothetical protein N2595_05635 [bacterium]|nr:hypothetical protein [bacterium]
MRGGSSLLLYVIVGCTLAFTVHMWVRVRGLGAGGYEDELRPIRQELREIRSDIEEINRVVQKQQASLYKIEALVELRRDREEVERGGEASGTKLMGGEASGFEEVPPPPSIDDRALTAFVRTQAFTGQAVQADRKSAPRTVVREERVSTASVHRQTVVFRSGARVSNAQMRANERSDVGTGVSEGLTLDELAALFSTVSVQGTETARGCEGGEQREENKIALGDRRSMVEVADPRLPGAQPVGRDATGVRGEQETNMTVWNVSAVAEAENKGGETQKHVRAAVPRRVTTVPSVTAEPRPEVPPVRAAKVVREQRALVRDIVTALSVSEQFVSSTTGARKVTIADILEAEEKEQE